jgi:hypothetical protein
LRALYADEDLCDDMECPAIFRAPDCTPGACPRAETYRKNVGAIYMIQGDDEGFVALLPGMKRS